MCHLSVGEAEIGWFLTLSGQLAWLLGELRASERPCYSHTNKAGVAVSVLSLDASCMPFSAATTTDIKSAFLSSGDRKPHETDASWSHKTILKSPTAG